MKLLRFALLCALVGALVIATPAKAERTKPNIRFFSGPQSAAHWTPKDSSDANRMSIELKVGPFTSGGYAGFVLNHVEGQPAPEEEPSFMHKEDRAGESGGSPRLVIQFVSEVPGTPNDITLRPDHWSTDWQLVGQGDGDGNWDVRGGTCGFRYDVTYEEALACHEDGIVAAAFVVSDSNWMPDKTTGYLNWIDQLQYNGFEFSHPSDNSNAA